MNKQITLPSIGFGGYRISNRSPEHRRALEKALDYGVKLIDTSANYCDGESELLIGEVLAKRKELPVIVSKAGYIQGQNLEELAKLQSQGKLTNGVTEIDENLKHSIHPDFLENQLKNSQKRLKLDKIDIYLLHNPEYYFYEKQATLNEYYRRIEQALLYLEEQREKGRIGYYGISSNNFILDPSDAKATQLTKIMEIVNKEKLEGFKVIQFPMNLIELGAMQKYNHVSLMDLAGQYGLKSMINRPLNAFSSQGLIRLASYDEFYKFPSSEKSRQQYDYCMQLTQEKWQQDEEARDEDMMSIPVLKQFSEIWDKLPSQDAVDQVFRGHYFPLLANIWGGQGLGPQESAPFYELYEMASLLARKNMSDKAKLFHKQAIESGLLPQDAESKNLAVAAIEQYLSYGVDCVLVGMRKLNYVEQLKQLF